MGVEENKFDNRTPSKARESRLGVDGLVFGFRVGEDE